MARIYLPYVIIKKSPPRWHSGIRRRRPNEPEDMPDIIVPFGTEEREIREIIEESVAKEKERIAKSKPIAPEKRAREEEEDEIRRQRGDG